MRFITNTLFFIFIFFLFKETTYFAFELVKIDDNQIFIGEPKDMLIMQVGILTFTILMVFLFYFIENFYKNLFKNRTLGKIITLIILLITEILTLSIIFFLKTYNVLNIYSKTYLFALSISAIIIISLILVVIFIFPTSRLKRFRIINGEK